MNIPDIKHKYNQKCDTKTETHRLSSLQNLAIMITDTLIQNDWQDPLNVGGTIFETTRTTLTSAPDSLLAKMFDVDSSLPPASTSEDRTFRLDACPRGFAVILNWLQYKRVILGGAEAKDVIDITMKPSSSQAQAKLKKSLASWWCQWYPVADYFGLQDLSKE